MKGWEEEEKERRMEEEPEGENRGGKHKGWGIR